jgi:acyl-CoA thioester hydrolase
VHPGQSFFCALRKGARRDRAARNRESVLDERPMSEAYRTSRRVEFRDTDAAGIVHFSVFFTWMESAEHELLRALGLSVVSQDGTDTITWPRVAVRCDYQGPARFEQLVDIEVHVARIGAKSVTYEFQFTGLTGTLAVGETTAVCCRIQPDGSFRSISIPEGVRTALATYQSS